ncbi:MAG TPA: magnesium protoporphyrin IX methyltransferase [Gemmatimonadales bacterium]|nr:magnesium protoporphyrin IX methyltransferase [Gemmatimonadales bacterium]
MTDVAHSRPSRSRLPSTWAERRAWIEQYFDRTAVDAWARLTSDAPVSRIRATVRAGRNRMRATLADWLPQDLAGCRVLDAGCGTGQLAVELARRGAEVTAVDLSPTLVQLARERLPADLRGGRVEFRAGDFVDEALGHFDYVVAMDSLIHYKPADASHAVARLAMRTRRAILFTFAPRTPLLAAMHAVGQLFPRGNRSPSVEPVPPDQVAGTIARAPLLAGWALGRSARVSEGFYISQAQELLAR